MSKKTPNGEENMEKTIILDFDGTFYQTPCHDIPKLEDAIDLSQLKLLKDKLKQAPNSQAVLRLLDSRFEKLHKYKITANLYSAFLCKSFGTNDGSKRRRQPPCFGHAELRA